ncbi:MAG: hypothetical protein ABIO04_05030 [Ferruginibacter sp.]
MKKFIINSIIFISVLVVILQVRPMYLLYHDKYKETVTGSEIYYSIFKSKQRKKSKKILLGDSVGNQLFPNKTNNDTVNSLACNQSIGMIGNFLLLNNYLKAGNQVDTVFLLFSPITFQNNLNQVYTYHYFLKPFYTDEYKPLFTETVKDQISKIPLNCICRNPLILTSNWAPDFSPADKTDYSFLSPVSAEYLQKMKTLGEQHNFRLVILPTPISLTKKALVDKMDTSEIVKYDLQNEFKDYFSNIIYLDDSIFIDGTHFKKPLQYTAYYKQKFIK